MKMLPASQLLISPVRDLVKLEMLLSFRLHLEAPSIFIPIQENVMERSLGFDQKTEVSVAIVLNFLFT